MDSDKIRMQSVRPTNPAQIQPNLARVDTPNSSTPNVNLGNVRPLIQPPAPQQLLSGNGPPNNIVRLPQPQQLQKQTQQLQQSQQQLQPQQPPLQTQQPASSPQLQQPAPPPPQLRRADSRQILQNTPQIQPQQQQQPLQRPQAPAQQQNPQYQATQSPRPPPPGVIQSSPQQFQQQRLPNPGVNPATIRQPSPIQQQQQQQQQQPLQQQQPQQQQRQPQSQQSQQPQQPRPPFPLSNQQNRPQIVRPQIPPNNQPLQQQQPIQQQGQSSLPLNQPQFRPQTIPPQRPLAPRSPFPQQQQQQQQPPTPQFAQPMQSTSINNNTNNHQLKSQNSAENIIKQQEVNKMASDIVTIKKSDTLINNNNNNNNKKNGKINDTNIEVTTDDDDDDDVVIGQAVTPSKTPTHSISSPYQSQKNGNIINDTVPGNRNNNNTLTSSMHSSPIINNVPHQIERTDSNKSLSSRPPSETDLLKKPIGGTIETNTINVTEDASKINLKDRPPSVTFKDDIKYSTDQKQSKSPTATDTTSILKSAPSPSSSVGGNKSPVSLNSIINAERKINGISKEELIEGLIASTTPSPPVTLSSPLPSASPSKLTTNKTIDKHVTDGNDKKIKSSLKHKGDNDSGVDESTQGNERTDPGSLNSPLKSPTKIPGFSRPPSATSSNKSQDKQAPPSRTESQAPSRSESRSQILKTPEPSAEVTKKVPMNKIQVGNAPSPNLKQIRSKIGSLDNASHKPGGGHVKIETKKLEYKVTPRIEAKNEKYISKGGEKKITHTKLQWNAKSRIGSLENAHHKPGGGDKKIESIKTEFKEKAKPKVGSKDNVKYAPGGGDVKIPIKKLEIKAQSKIGSLDNVKHKPGGGDKKIFDDKDYLKNVDHPISPNQPSGQQAHHWSSIPSSLTTSMSLPAECIVLSVTSPSPNKKLRRMSGCSLKTSTSGRAWHPKPFKLY